MAIEANSARITGKVQGRDIVLDGPLSKDEIRDRVWWWQTAAPRTSGEREDRRHEHEYDDSRRDVIATLGGYYEVPGDPRAPEAAELTEMLYAELNPDG
ncbi:hypothetical protein [Streptomyces sp. PanSC9]|uniref:hypothetical protein n=1 Tax=Streptomyces sp. PanSC9 TaxID=1520461 RepID=UPI000F4A3C82|nr:hypothetical protein [Streptomyces sp. PanSC9]ROP56024.1 hypothetical protein EDD94_5619 [Streptomyces sp. PanSC9]